MSQVDRIGRYLDAGHGLTSLGALSRFGCFRLAARVNELRRNGLKIETHTIRRGGKRYALYRAA